MDSLKAWLQDQKNLPIVAAGTIIIIILVIFVLLRSSGVIGKKRPTFSEPTNQPDMPMPIESPQGAGTVPPTAPTTAPVTPTAPTRATPAVGMSPGAQPQASTEVAKLAPMLPYRKDPFVSASGRPNVKFALMNILPSITPPRLTAAPIVTGPDMSVVAETTAPQPFRRMSGALWNGKVAAILETEGVSDIVRPGMEITRSGSRVRVESIQPNYIILKTLDTKTPITIKVNMAGSVTNTSPTGTRPGYNTTVGPLDYPGGPIGPGM